MNDPTSQGGGQVHGLGTLVHPRVLPTPVHYTHLHEVIQNPISENNRVMSSKFLHDANGIPPEAVIKVTLVEDMFGPTLFIEPLFPQKDCSMQHLTINLANH